MRVGKNPNIFRISLFSRHKKAGFPKVAGLTEKDQMIRTGLRSVLQHSLKYLQQLVLSADQA